MPQAKSAAFWGFITFFPLIFCSSNKVATRVLGWKDRTETGASWVKLIWLRKLAQLSIMDLMRVRPSVTLWIKCSERYAHLCNTCFAVTTCPPSLQQLQPIDHFQVQALWTLTPIPSSVLMDDGGGTKPEVLQLASAVQTWLWAKVTASFTQRGSKTNKSLSRRVTLGSERKLRKGRTLGHRLKKKHEGEGMLLLLTCSNLNTRRVCSAASTDMSCAWAALEQHHQARMRKMKKGWGVLSKLSPITAKHTDHWRKLQLYANATQ